MIESLANNESRECWYTHLYTMPMAVNVVGQSEVEDSVWWPEMGMTIQYGDLYDTEREALEVARKLRLAKIAERTAEVAELNQKIYGTKEILT